MSVVVAELVEGLVVFSQEWPIAFPHRLQVVNVKASLTNVRFPKAGKYAISHFVDEDLIAERILAVLGSKT